VAIAPLVLLLLACGDDSSTLDGGSTPSDAARTDRGVLARDVGPRPDVEIPAGTGWFELPDTELIDICPDDESIHAVGGCGAIAAAWGGGAADRANERLLVWGGGHNDYWGNEVYALNLRTLGVELLTQPSPPTPMPDDCGLTTLPDGRPNSRHTYDNLAYIEPARRMFAWGGATACRPGGGIDDTWTFDVDALEWTRMDPTNGDGPPQAFIASTDYDAETDLVFLHNTHGLWSYDYDTNTYRELAPDTASDYHLTGRVDPSRRVFVMLGGGEAWAFDLATYERSALSLGCSSIVDAAYPGMAYDPVEQKIIAWAGGDSVYAIDADAETCEERTFPGGPGDQQPNGTNGRFRYFGSIDAYALVNAFEQNAYLLRLRPVP
jgi:hypothetical protein